MTSLEAREQVGALLAVLEVQARAVLVAAESEKTACAEELKDVHACLKCESLLDQAQQMVSAVALAKGAHSSQTPSEFAEGLREGVADFFGVKR